MIILIWLAERGQAMSENKETFQDWCDSQYEKFKNGDIAFPNIKTNFLVKYDFEFSPEENLQKAIAEDIEIRNTISDFNLLYGGYVCTISLEPKIKFHGFKRHELTIETPYGYMGRGGIYAKKNIH